MEKEYNIINDINNYKNDICQVLDDITKINNKLELLKELLNKRINDACKELPYIYKLITTDQLSKKMSVEYILKKYNIFYSYYKKESNNFINYVNFEIKDGIIINTFDMQYCVSKDELERDKNSLSYIFKCINNLIDALI